MGFVHALKYGYLNLQCFQSPKTLFLPFFGPFFRKSRERVISEIWHLRRKLANQKVQKPYFWAFLGLFGPFLPIFEKMRIFPKNPALSLFYVYGPLTSCKKLEKTNEPILRTLRHVRTDGRH